MAGKIQGADMKTEAELIAAGTDKTALTRDTQIYVTANSINKTLDDAITDGDIGSGSGGGVNFLASADSTFVSSTGSWATFDDGAVAVPVDGTGGSPTVITISRVTSFDSAGSLRISHSAANGQGEGASVLTATVQPKHRGAACSITGTYKSSSGYVDDGLHFWIYDVTNAQLIQPAPYTLKANTSSGKFKFEFQTSATGASYRLIAFCPNTTATAYDVDIDDISVGPTSYNYGLVATDFKTVTGFTSSLTTNTTLTVIGRRVGDMFEGYAKMAFTGAPNAATNPVITLPAGMVIDTTKLIDTSGGNTTVGHVALSDTGVASYYGNVAYISTTTLEWQYFNGNGAGGIGSFAGATSTTPFTIASGDKFIAYFKFPVVGWASNVQLSDTASIRRNTARYSTNSSQSISNASSTIIDFATKTYDDLGLVTTGGSWKWTANKACRIRVNAMVTLATGGGWAAGEQANLSIFKTGSEVARSLNTQTATHSQIVMTQVADEFDMLAGDYIDIRMFQNSGGAITLNGNHSDTYVTISEIQGPSAIAATDDVYCKYGNASGVTFTNSVDQTIIFTFKHWDTHGAYNTSTGAFTAPVSGLYLISYGLYVNGFTAAADDRFVSIYLYKNSVATELGGMNGYARTTASIVHQVHHTVPIKLLAGETLHMHGLQNLGSTPTITSNTEYGFFSAQRIGNY